MTPYEQQLRELLQSGTGCGPIGATVRVAVRDGFLEVHALVEHPIKHLPVPGAPRHAAAADVGIRVGGPEAREFHVAFHAKLHQPRPALQFWGAPVVDLPLSQYASSQRTVDDTHYEFNARAVVVVRSDRGATRLPDRSGGLPRRMSPGAVLNGRRRKAPAGQGRLFAHLAPCTPALLSFPPQKRSFRPVETGACPYCPKSDFLSVGRQEVPPCHPSRSPATITASTGSPAS